MAYMYVLYSRKLDKYYVGSCKNIVRRIYEHNIGHSRFTSFGIPWDLVYHERFDNQILARKREMHIKKQKSRKNIISLINKKDKEKKWEG
jgi:putative endonuclease